MRSMHLSFLLLLSAMLMAVSCKTSTRNEQKNAILEEFQMNLSDADSCWNVMQISDDLKIQNMDRLAGELLLINGSDSLGIVALRKKIGSLKEQRYNQFSIGQSGKIDFYDSLSTNLILALKKEVSRNPKAIEFQIVNQLVNEITMADDSVLFFRKEYDRIADKLNLGLKKHGKKLKAEVPGLDTVSKFPLFRLIP